MGCGKSVGRSSGGAFDDTPRPKLRGVSGSATVARVNQRANSVRHMNRNLVAALLTDEISSADPQTLNFFRPIPPNGRRCLYSGLTHASMYRQLVYGEARHHVRVANLKQPGQVRAQTLYHVGDWVAYLSRLAEEQRAAAALKNSGESV